MKTLSILPLLGANLKIVNRTMNILWLLVVVVASQLALHLVGNKLIPVGRFPLLVVVICYFVAAFIFDDFLAGGENERILYRVVPVNLERVVRGKNIAAMLAFAALLVPSLLIESVSFEASVENMTGACLYALTSIFLMLHVGNYVSARFGMVVSSKRAPLFPMVEAAILLVVSLPYWLLSSVAGSILSCLLFSFLTAVSWYYFSVPSTARLLRRIKDNSHDDEQLR